MEGAREVALRVAEARAQLGDAFEAEDIAARRQRGEAVELGLDRGVAGTGVVGHGECSAYPNTARPELVEGPFFLLPPHEEGRCFDKLSTNGIEGSVLD
jgi:hypothetical protein